MSRIDEILNFWFGAPGEPGHDEMRDVWFKPTEEFNRELQERFMADYERAAAGELDDWRQTARGSLTLILLLDQFPANVFKGDDRVFATDAKALEIAESAVDRGLDRELPEMERWFIYLPFEHSESLEVQRRSVELWNSLSDTPVNQVGKEFAVRHLRVIERFGRFPNRNAALGRESTPEEIAFLNSPEAPF